MADNEEACVFRRDVGRDFLRAMQQQICHSVMIAHRLTILDQPLALSRYAARELQFAWNDFLREISLTDEIRHDIHIVAFDHSPHFPEARLLLPKGANHFPE